MTTGISRLVLAWYTAYLGKIATIRSQSGPRSSAPAVRASAKNTSAPTWSTTSGCAQQVEVPARVGGLAAARGDDQVAVVVSGVVEGGAAQRARSSTARGDQQCVAAVEAVTVRAVAGDVAVDVAPDLTDRVSLTSVTR